MARVSGSRPGDRAGADYWETVWSDQGLAREVDPDATGRDGEVVRRLDRRFRRALGPMPQGMRLLEIGCANSAWLPYFARRFGFEVTGIDYSPVGCEQARAVLTRSGITGTVVEADFLGPPNALVGAFDAIVSFGVVEHFDDTVATLRAFRSFLNERGVAFTLVPNMTGITGALQRTMNQSVYHTHVPLTREQLVAAHEEAGLAVRWCEYVLSTHFGVVNLNGLDLSRRSVRARTSALLQLSRVSKAIWAAERRLAPLPATRLFSPYVVCVAERV